jgi:hypothetical protein
MLLNHHIDIVSIQETKKQEFKETTLSNISYKITHWFILPAIGRSGGILVGVNDTFFEIIDCKILAFFYYNSS